MASVNGDLKIDFSLLSDVNPYIDPSLDAIGTTRILSGSCRGYSSGASGFKSNTAVEDANALSSKVTFNENQPSGDPCGPALINSAGNGYWLRCQNTATAIYSIIGNSPGSLIGAAVNGGSGAGDDAIIEIDESTGLITTYLNGVQLDQITDTNYTGLQAGFFYDFQNNRTAGITEWAADGYAALGPSLAQADTTPEDGVQQTVTCTGMTGPITAATLGGYDILSLLSGTDPASPITYTLDISALAEGTNASLPRLGVSLDLVFTTATDGAVTQSGIVIQPKTGWALVELEDTINKDANGLVAVIEADTGLTVTNADALYYETANNASITVNGVYTSDLTTTGQSTKIILQNGGTSPATSYSDGFYPYGEAGGGSGEKVVQSISISNLRIGL